MSSHFSYYPILVILIALFDERTKKSRHFNSSLQYSIACKVANRLSFFIGFVGPYVNGWIFDFLCGPFLNQNATVWDEVTTLDPSNYILKHWNSH